MNYIGLKQGKKRDAEGRNVEPEDDHELIIRLKEAMVFLRTLNWSDKAAMDCAMNIAYCLGWLRTHFRQEREKNQ